MVKKNNGWLIGCCVFLLVGIIFAAIGIGVYISNENFKSKAIKTESVISEIRERKDSDGKTVHDVYVSFHVRGKEYGGRIGEYSSSMYEGQELIVYYNSDNPADFRRCNIVFPLASGLFGFVFIGIGAIPIIFSIRKNKVRKKFLANDVPYRNEKSTFSAKRKVLEEAPMVLNKPNQSWYVTIEGNSIVANWNWKSGIYQSTENEFVYSVTLNDAGRWTEDLDKMEKISKHSGEKSWFVGKTYQKSVEVSFAKNKETGKREIEKKSMDTAEIKRAVRAYLKDCGWRKM
ncbi:DUF3592 domain-containing protein [Anaerosporobacter sp.]|uniref:DUF3592 domain-containing protein n=1 Tax=Anaerosporobacter sp. TaxID=1872529 RepID=UPI00286FA33A|nr:DUF3592 domain-containing protein [Anaerosporobacter sp.]